MVVAHTIGAVIRFDAKETLVGATLLRLRFKKPSKATGVWVAHVQGTNFLEFVTSAESDVDEVGIWQVQAEVTRPGQVVYSTPDQFNVLRRL